MSDQHVITDWRAYLDALGPRVPYAGPTHTDMFPGPPRPTISFARRPDDALSSVDIADGETVLDVAKETWEANEGPEMWLFVHTGGPPWHCDPAPKKRGAKGGSGG